MNLEQKGNLFEAVDSRASLVDPLLHSSISSVKESSLLHEALSWAVFPGGKRLRPALTVLAAETVKGNVDLVLPAAAAFELLHNFTLIHDDMISSTSSRRDKETVNSKFGKHVALIAGDVLFSLAYDVLHDTAKSAEVPSKVLAAFNYFNTSCNDLARGQLSYLELQRSSRPSIADYKTVVDSKTCSLFVGPLKSGALLAGGEERAIDALEMFGYCFGQVFQIKEDILGIEGADGEGVGRDLVLGRRSMVTVHALNKLDKDRESFLEVLDKAPGATSDGDVEEAMDLLKRTKS
ncbi:MAG: polyprenyl synthetase family protein, partial [Candidatus Diapherotrites archaeon]|nr:polyprenyl synthetase family protein [Candidatus Diapherotrites archaeon]